MCTHQNVFYIGKYIIAELYNSVLFELLSWRSRSHDHGNWGLKWHV